MSTISRPSSLASTTLSPSGPVASKWPTTTTVRHQHWSAAGREGDHLVGPRRVLGCVVRLVVRVIGVVPAFLVDGPERRVRRGRELLQRPVVRAAEPGTDLDGQRELLVLERAELRGQRVALREQVEPQLGQLDAEVQAVQAVGAQQRQRVLDGDDRVGVPQHLGCDVGRSAHQLLPVVGDELGAVVEQGRPLAHDVLREAVEPVLGDRREDVGLIGESHESPSRDGWCVLPKRGGCQGEIPAAGVVRAANDPDVSSFGDGPSVPVGGRS